MPLTSKRSARAHGAQPACPPAQPWAEHLSRRPAASPEFPLAPQRLHSGELSIIPPHRPCSPCWGSLSPLPVLVFPGGEPIIPPRAVLPAGGACLPQTQCWTAAETPTTALASPPRAALSSSTSAPRDPRWCPRMCLESGGKLHYSLSPRPHTLKKPLAPELGFGATSLIILCPPQAGLVPDCPLPCLTLRSGVCQGRGWAHPDQKKEPGPQV